MVMGFVMLALIASFTSGILVGYGLRGLLDSLDEVDDQEDGT